MFKLKHNDMRRKALIWWEEKGKTEASPHSVFISLECDSDLIAHQTVIVRV